jgi:hypothetical protein
MTHGLRFLRSEAHAHTELFCPADNNNAALSASFPSTAAGSVAVGTCQSPLPNGAPQRRCNADGTWSATVLSNACTAGACPALTNDNNANWAAGTTGASTTGTCVAGYTGSPSRPCLGTGAWGTTISNPCTRTFSFFLFVVVCLLVGPVGMRARDLHRPLPAARLARDSMPADLVQWRLVCGDWRRHHDGARPVRRRLDGGHHPQLLDHRPVGRRLARGVHAYARTRAGPPRCSMESSAHSGGWGCDGCRDYVSGTHRGDDGVAEWHSWHFHAGLLLGWLQRRTHARVQH